MKTLQNQFQESTCILNFLAKNTSDTRETRYPEKISKTGTDSWSGGKMAFSSTCPLWQH